MAISVSLSWIAHASTMASHTRADSFGQLLMAAATVSAHLEKFSVNQSHVMLPSVQLDLLCMFQKGHVVQNVFQANANALIQKLVINTSWAKAGLIVMMNAMNVPALLEDEFNVHDDHVMSPSQHAILMNNSSLLSVVVVLNTNVFAILIFAAPRNQLAAHTCTLLRFPMMVLAAQITNVSAMSKNV
jgi:hypothetical protein